MCGSTGAQNTIQQEQLDQYTQMQTMTAQMYKDQQEIYGPMENQFQSIFAKGPSQEGFSQAEEGTLDAQATEGTAENAGAAERAVNEQEAAQGGDTVAPSGADLELQQEARMSAANEQSNEETQIKEADYNQGYQEWQQAGQGLMGIAAGDNPLGYAGTTINAGAAAGNTANQIAQDQNSWINAAIGAAGAAAGGWAQGGFKTP